MVRKVLLGITAGLLLVAGDSVAEEKTPAQPTQKREVKVKPPREVGGPARVETTVGTFEVSPKNVDLFREVLAGKPGSPVLYAGEDLP